MVLALGEEIAAQAIVGSIVWALRRNKEPRSREMISSATRFIAYAPNFPFFYVWSLYKLIAFSVVDNPPLICWMYNGLRFEIRIFYFTGVKENLIVQSVLAMAYSAILATVPENTWEWRTPVELQVRKTWGGSFFSMVKIFFENLLKNLYLMDKLLDRLDIC